MGKPCTILTDYKPLVRLFLENQCVLAMAAALLTLLPLSEQSSAMELSGQIV